MLSGETKSIKKKKKGFARNGKAGKKGEKV